MHCLLARWTRFPLYKIRNLVFKTVLILVMENLVLKYLFSIYSKLYHMLSLLKLLHYNNYHLHNWPPIMSDCCNLNPEIQTKLQSFTLRHSDQLEVLSCPSKQRDEGQTKDTFPSVKVLNSFCSALVSLLNRLTDKVRRQGTQISLSTHNKSFCSMPPSADKAEALF